VYAVKKKGTISGKFCLDLELLREYQSPFATIVSLLPLLIPSFASLLPFFVCVGSHDFIASVPQLAWDEKSLSLLWLLLLELRPGLKKHALT